MRIECKSREDGLCAHFSDLIPAKVDHLQRTAIDANYLSKQLGMLMG